MFVFPDAEVLRTDAAFRKNGRCFRQHESRPADRATSEMDKVPIVGVTIDAGILAHRRDKHAVAELEVPNGERIKKMWHDVYATSFVTSFSGVRRSRLQEFPDLLSFGQNYLDLNGPSKTLSESFRRSFGVSRACNFSGSNSFGPGLPTAAIAST